MATDRGVDAYYPGLRLWWDELNAGIDGQDPSRPTTWKKDALWRAATWEASARENHPEDINEPLPAWKAAMRNAAESILEAAGQKAKIAA